jgi:hypothetical protein
MAEELSLVSRIKEVSPPFYVACAGGIEKILGVFTGVPGISTHYLGGVSCYHPVGFRRFCGTKLSEGFCSENGAILLARGAYREAQSLGDLDVLGIGITAALSTTRALKGGNRVWLACVTKDAVYTDVLELAVEASRVDQIHVSIRWCLDRIYNMACRAVPDLKVLGDIASLHEQAQSAPMLLDVDGSISHLVAEDLREAIVFPGSFNPLHFGHLRIAQLLSMLTGREVVWELCLSNADVSKPSLIVEDLERRLPIMRGSRALVGNLPLFVDKARVYRTDFAVGADTWQRIFDVSYLRAGQTKQELLAEFERLGVEFFVFQRAGSQMQASPYMIPANWEVSSTEMRN